MQSTKPYLIRAIHEWCADRGFTPYLSVSVDATTRVPREFVKDGEIVLNIGLEATNQLLMGNEEISFQARFGGRAFPVVVPIERVAAIYARENGEGMAFEVTEKAAADAGKSPDVRQGLTEAITAKDLSVEGGASAAVSPAPTSERPTGKPQLTRVK
ncbi:MAG: ClpXP protease specificity-enhancing factor [Rhodocyclales bacterium GWA2_65_19]|nr:MAG: ClpXP protease specificity-enhancing factor [Rhodocyclales bacterium GWA2_65_19]